MNFLQKLCKELGLEEAKEVERSVFNFILNPKISIQIKDLQVGFHLYSVIAPCPNEKREELFIYLMKANFLGQGTLGAVIGLSPDEKNLTLSKALPYEVTYRVFKETIEDFTNILEYWRNEIA